MIPTLVVISMCGKDFLFKDIRIELKVHLQKTISFFFFFFFYFKF